MWPYCLPWHEQVAHGVGGRALTSGGRPLNDDAHRLINQLVVRPLLQPSGSALSFKVYRSHELVSLNMERFDGPSRKPGVNLSTGLSSSSADLLSSVRAERQAREQRRREDAASAKIQRAWRRRQGIRDVQRDLLRQLEAAQLNPLEARRKIEETEVITSPSGNGTPAGWSWRQRAMGLVLLLREGWAGVEMEEKSRVAKALTSWAAEVRDEQARECSGGEGVMQS